MAIRETCTSCGGRGRVKVPGEFFTSTCQTCEGSGLTPIAEGTMGIEPQKAARLPPSLEVPLPPIQPPFNPGHEAAHAHALLARLGWIVCPPGSIPMPRNIEEARAMYLLSQNYLGHNRGVPES